MVKLATKSRYAVLACFHLALKNDLMNLSEISNLTDISVGYLEQLFIKLKKYNIVESVRGSNGGYKLVKPSDEVTLKEIIIALEGDIEMAPCQGKECCKSNDCPTKNIWTTLNGKVENMLEEVKLSSLLEDYKNGG